MKSNQSNMYYVYVYKDQNGQPYYIGKGKGNRAWKHGSNDLVPSPANQYIEIFKKNLPEREALDLEIDLISKFGRLDEGTGYLQNRTSGGDNPPSQKGRVVPEERRKRISESLTGRPSPKKGIPLSAAHKAKIKKNHPKHWLGKKRSAETISRMSCGRKGKMTGASHPGSVQVMTPHGIFYTLKDAAKSFSVGPGTISNRCNSNSTKFKEYYRF